MEPKRLVYCQFCGQIYVAGRGDRCSLCGKTGGLVDPPAPPPSPHFVTLKDKYTPLQPTSDFFSLLLHPMAPPVFMSLATAVMGFVRVGVGGVPGYGVALQYGWGLMVVLWMDADSRKLRRVPCYDFGILALIFFPFSLFWYCFWSRRWRGLLVFLLLLSLWLVPQFLVAFLFVLLDSP